MMNDESYAVVDPAMLLESFDEPIVIHRSFLRIVGSVNAALLLTWLVDVAQVQDEQSGGWVSLTKADWEAQTGLSRYEQETARRVLRERGLITERRVGMPARLEMKLNARNLADQMRELGRARYGAYLAERENFMHAGGSVTR